MNANDYKTILQDAIMITDVFSNLEGSIWTLAVLQELLCEMLASNQDDAAELMQAKLFELAEVKSPRDEICWERAELELFADMLQDCCEAQEEGNWI